MVFKFTQKIIEEAAIERYMNGDIQPLKTLVESKVPLSADFQKFLDQVYLKKIKNKRGPKPKSYANILVISQMLRDEVKRAERLFRWLGTRNPVAKAQEDVASRHKDILIPDRLLKRIHPPKPKK